MFIALSVSIEVIRALRPVLAALRTRSDELRDQLERAATRVSLNLAEGSKRTGKDPQHFYRIAAGSCAEARAALAVTDALGHVDGIDPSVALALLDRRAVASTHTASLRPCGAGCPLGAAWYTGDVRSLTLILVAGLSSGCPKRQPAPLAQSPGFVSHEVQQMKAAKTDVEAAQKNEEARDDKLLDSAK